MLICNKQLICILILALTISMSSHAIASEASRTVVSPEMETPAGAVIDQPANHEKLSGSRVYDKVKSATVTIATEAGMGSGFIVSPYGYILTNWHVVFDPKSFNYARQVKVRLFDSRVRQARIIKTDPELDIALLKIEGKGYHCVEIGDAHRLEVGDTIYIIGAPQGLEHSMTTGIISAFNREKGRIQTSAVIHKGNSGGPVFNVRGEVVAIAVSAELSDREAWVNLSNGKKPVAVSSLLAGISYMIPINHARNLLNLTK